MTWTPMKSKTVNTIKYNEHAINCNKHTINLNKIKAHQFNPNQAQ